MRLVGAYRFHYYNAARRYLYITIIFCTSRRRFQGASLLVVKGERNLRTCGMLQHNNNKARMNEIYFPKAEEQVKITFATNGESRESPRDHLVTGPNNQNDNSSTEDKGNDAAGINGVKTVEHKEVLEPVPFAKNDKIANATSAKRKLRHARKKLKPTTIKKERLKAKPWKKNKGKSEKSRQVRSLEAELNAEMNEDTNNLEDLGSSEVQVSCVIYNSFLLLFDKTDDNKNI